jgi:hypothetical protein
MDLDQGGRGFQKVRTFLGPSLGWAEELVGSSVRITTGGTYNVQAGDSVILIDVAAVVTINLPDVIKWWQQTANQPATGFERSLTVKDIGGNAANFNITIAPFGAQKIDNIQASTIINQARAAVKLLPLVDLTGWAVSLASTTGASGGGGDVFKAGDNTYTGINTFNNTITVPTVATADNSQNAASTAFVKAQNYVVSSALASYAPINNPVLTGDPQAPTPAPGNNTTSIATTAFAQNLVNGYQPLDGDLTSIAGQNATDAFFYRQSANTWLPVAMGSGITFAGGTLTVVAGGGNVSNVGTPTSGQLARWTTSNTIEGVSLATAGIQPLDGDLTALSALAGTNTIYYRSGADIWSPVTFSGLTFSGGVLTVTVGGGNVSNSGTPTIDQVAVWTDATHIKGAAATSLGLAPLASPTFTGDPKAPTPGAGDNDTSLATTAFVQSAIVAGRQIPAGTYMLFFMPSAPTGWVLYTAHHDRVLRVVNTSGQSGGGVWPFTTVFAKTGTDYTTLDINQIPSHSHSFPQALAGTINSGYYVDPGASYQIAVTEYSSTSANGGSGGHNHPMDIRVLYTDVIICQKS